jgi:hypothetical protein
MKASLFVEIGDLRCKADFNDVEDMADLQRKIEIALPLLQQQLDHTKSMSHEVRPG